MKKNLLLISRAACGTLALISLLAVMLCPFAFDVFGGGQLGSLACNIAFGCFLPFFGFGLAFVVLDEKINF